MDYILPLAPTGTIPLFPEWIQLWGQTMARSADPPDPTEGSFWAEAYIQVSASHHSRITIIRNEHLPSGNLLLSNMKLGK
jgi:hypothetical protein